MEYLEFRDVVAVVDLEAAVVKKADPKARAGMVEVAARMEVEALEAEVNSALRSKALLKVHLSIASQL